MHESIIIAYESRVKILITAIVHEYFTEYFKNSTVKVYEFYIEYFINNKIIVYEYYTEYFINSNSI